MDRIYRRGKTYYADIHYGGRRIRRSMRTAKKKLAEKRFEELTRRIGTGEENLDRTITFDEFRAKFMKYTAMDKKRRTVETYGSVLDNFSRFLKSSGLGGSRLHSVAVKEVIEKYKVYRSAGVTARTINNDLSVLRRFFNVAISFNHLKENPVSGVEMLREPKNQRRVFSMSELELILDNSTPQRRDLYEFLLHSCLRIMEAIHLTWEDIDWSRGVVRVREKSCDCHRCGGSWSPKSYEAREVPINNTMRGILERQNRFSRWVFSNSRGDILNRNHVWVHLKRLCGRLGIEDATIHGFRHTGATIHARNGTPVAVLQKILGHKNLPTTQIYFHLDVRDTVTAMHAFEEMVEKEMENARKTGTYTSQ